MKQKCTETLRIPHPALPAMLPSENKGDVYSVTFHEWCTPFTVTVSLCKASVSWSRLWEWLRHKSRWIPWPQVMPEGVLKELTMMALDSRCSVVETRVHNAGAWRACSQPKAISTCRWHSSEFKAITVFSVSSPIKFNLISGLKPIFFQFYSPWGLSSWKHLFWVQTIWREMEGRIEKLKRRNKGKELNCGKKVEGKKRDVWPERVSCAANLPVMIHF